MKEQLTQAIESYCTLLPYLNNGSQPNDDKRLYLISYYAFKCDRKHIEPEDLLLYLKLNDSINQFADEVLEEFAQNRCSEINHAVYILDRLSDNIK